MTTIFGGSLKVIVARWQCGGCGKAFESELDEGYESPPGWSMFDVALDQMRGGNDGASVQGGYLLCPECTRACDETIPEAEEPTREAVERVLGRMKE